MSERIKDGGPAFPVMAGQTVYSHGMLLRDYFAGQALAGALANPNIHKEAEALGVPCLIIAVPVAWAAADAMIAARAGGQSDE